MKITNSTLLIFAVYLVVFLVATLINHSYPGYSAFIFTVLLNLQIVAYFTVLYLSFKRQ